MIIKEDVVVTVVVIEIVHLITVIEIIIVTVVATVVTEVVQTEVEIEISSLFLLSPHSLLFFPITYF